MFEKKSLLDTVKSYDVYGQILEGNRKKTFIGAGLFTFVLSTYLIIYTYYKTFDIRSSSEMKVDLSKGSSQLKINLDMTIKALPCSLITLLSEDHVGTFSSQFNEILKHRLDSNGKLIQRNIPLNQVHNPEFTDETYQKIKEELTVLKEGCLITGIIEVNRVPGALYFTSRPYQDFIAMLIKEPDSTYFLDLSHRINHLSFGDKTDLEFISKNYDTGTLDPLEGFNKNDNRKNNLFQYYLNIVPTKYTDINLKEYNANQYTANHHIVEEPSMFPAIFFQYDISPIIVHHTQTRPSMFKTFINFCAIIGGLFALTGTIDSFLDKMISKSIKKD